jgi:hypothetical protein
MADDQNHKPPGYATSRLSVHYIAYVAEAALGEDPELPIGCGILLIICTNLLNNQWYSGFVVHYRALLEKFAYFLTIRRTDERYAELRAKFPICRCRHGPPALRDAHPALHDIGDELGDVDRKLANFINLSYKLVIAKACSQIKIEKLYLTARTKHQTRTGFPSSPHDITPFGLKATIVALLRWAQRIPSMIVTVPVSHFLTVLITVFQADSIPVLVAVSPTLLSWIESTLVLFVEACNSERNPMLEYFSLVLARIGTMIDLLGQFSGWQRHEVLAFVQQGNASADLVDTCNTVALLCQSPKLKGTLSNPVLTHTMETTLKGVVDLAAWIRCANREMVSDTDVCALIVSRTMHFHNKSYTTNPHIRIMDAIGSLRHGGRCTAPECTLTQVSEGRKFKLCVGCRVNCYCSRQCQRRAWRHPLAPHQEICAHLKTSYNIICMHQRSKNIQRTLRELTTTIPMDIGHNCLRNLNVYKDIKKAVFCEPCTLPSKNNKILTQKQ